MYDKFEKAYFELLEKVQGWHGFLDQFSFTPTKTVEVPEDDWFYVLNNMKEGLGVLAYDKNAVHCDTCEHYKQNEECENPMRPACPSYRIKEVSK